MKIVHVLSHYLPGKVAGTEVYTSILVNYLKGKLHQVNIVIPNYNSVEDDHYIHDGIDVYKFAEPSITDRDLIMGNRVPEGLISFEKLLFKLKPDIVHFHELAGSNGITVYHIESAKKLGFKTVMTFHLSIYSCKTGNLMYGNRTLCAGIIDPIKCTSCNYMSRGLSKQFSYLLLTVAKGLYYANIDVSKHDSSLATALGFPFLIDKLKEDFKRISVSCDKLVSLTTWYKDILLSNGIPNEKITIIPQALPHLEVMLKKRKPFIGSVIKLLFIGRISSFKGLHLIIKALKGIPTDKVCLDIFGEDLHDSYSDTCKDLAVNLPNICWKGKLERNAVMNTIQCYDALVLPSTFSEMSPLVIQEAFAAGVPVIASNVYGNAEQVKHGYNGMLFDFNDASSLREIINQVIEDPYIFTNLASNLVPPSDFSVVGKAYLSMYRNILNDSSTN